MGHVDIGTTMNIYAEVSEAKKKQSMEALAKNMDLFWNYKHEESFSTYATSQSSIVHQKYINHLSIVPYNTLIERNADKRNTW